MSESVSFIYTAHYDSMYKAYYSLAHVRYYTSYNKMYDGVVIPSWVNSVWVYSDDEQNKWRHNKVTIGGIRE